MLRNYFMTAWRNIIRGKVYSALNILGLATGMAVALMIGLWVIDQASYDKFLPGYENSYQVRFNYNDNGVIRNQDHVCLPLGDALKKDIPEIAHVAPAFDFGQGRLELGDKRIYGHMISAGAEFLQVFPFPLVEGDAATALREPGTVVITESMAKAAFGNGPAMNKIVRMGGGDSRKVTAVVKDLPRNSSLHFDFLVPFVEFASGGWVKAATTNWKDAYFELYTSLRPGVDAARAEAKARRLVKQYAPDSYNTFHREPMFYALKDWHLVTDFKDGKAAGGLIDYVRMFSIVGVLVLLIACINFMNLSTARSEKRAREVGVRKVIGSSRQGLIFQFLMESVMLTFFAFVFSFLIVQAVLPAFNSLAGTSIHIPYGNGLFWLVMLSYVLLTGLLAGSRPAFYLSSFQPVKVLKGAMRVGRAATLPRKVLVVLQFTCSIALIISTVIVYQQIQYAKNRPRGYDPNRLIVTAGVALEKYPAFKQEVLQSGIVSSMTMSLTSATEVHSHNTIDNWPGRLPNEPFAPVMNAVADTDYFKTLGIGFVAGTNFKGYVGADSTSVIINEAAMRRMRLKQPINQTLTWSLSNAPNRLRIVGVVKDALTTNPFAAAEPTVFVYQPGWAWTNTSRLSPTLSTPVALEKLKTIYIKYNAETPFDYSFVDENYASKFALEMLIGRLAGIFAALAIFISCLGLFGLAAYIAEQRTKEIGIRKVLGASVAQVLVLLSGDFMLLVILSCVIASPVAYYFMNQWLDGYYYRIQINPLVFVAAAVVAILITAVTVSFQSIRTALMNPVRSLRSE
ncbi:ABC transporter permease [Flavitalea flava]